MRRRAVSSGGCPPPRFQYPTLLRYSNSAVRELSTVCGTSYGLADDHFHAETNSRGICGARRASVSFAEYSGTAVSRFSPSLRRESETQNERDDRQSVGGADLKRLADRPRGWMALPPARHRNGLLSKVRMDRLDELRCWSEVFGLSGVAHAKRQLLKGAASRHCPLMFRSAAERHRRS
jgi:hypothetical protein